MEEVLAFAVEALIWVLTWTFVERLLALREPEPVEDDDIRELLYEIRDELIQRLEDVETKLDELSQDKEPDADD